MDEKYSEQLDSLEAAVLGEQESVLAQYRGEDVKPNSDGAERSSQGHSPGYDSEDELKDGSIQMAAAEIVRNHHASDRATKRPSARTRMYKGNHHTGVKGILADYHEAQDEAARVRYSLCVTVSLIADC